MRNYRNIGDLTGTVAIVTGANSGWVGGFQRWQTYHVSPRKK